jgi:hypothetical protein
MRCVIAALGVNPARIAVRSGERAAGQQDLVIRVGVKRDDGGHPGHPGRCRSGPGAFV